MSPAIGTGVAGLFGTHPRVASQWSFKCVIATPFISSISVYPSHVVPSVAVSIDIVEAIGSTIANALCDTKGEELNRCPKDGRMRVEAIKVRERGFGMEHHLTATFYNRLGGSVW